MRILRRLLWMAMPGAWLLCFLLLSSLLQSRAIAADASQPRAKTAQGEIAGKWIAGGSQKAFLGLPYAAPPTGRLRWKSPQPPASWKGTRDATKYAGRCEQYHIWNDYIFQDAGPTEDCLYLNVYAPASAKPGSNLPVMFWIHGGGFVAGSGSEPRYSNSALVLKGVVLVTINYRLGVFGFLTSEELAREDDGHAGNYGLMDMVAALRWVKANINYFGGDSGNVTIFGESAGSFAINALTVAPDARGLFQKAIGESGAFFGAAIPMSALVERNQKNQQWIESLGVKNLAELRDLPAGKILEAVQKKPGFGFAPVIDGKFLPQSIPDAYASGQQAHIPEIIGWNRDERGRHAVQGHDGGEVEGLCFGPLRPARRRVFGCLPGE
jgi:para-nitrobenzyl esterase